MGASRSRPISLRIVPDGPSGRRGNFGAISPLRAKIGISLRVGGDCGTSNGEAGRRWRAEVAGRSGNFGRRPQPDLAASALETRVARNRSTGSTRPATPNHPVGDPSTASGPVGGASHIEPTHVEPTDLGRRRSLRGRGQRRARHRHSGGAPGERSRMTGQPGWPSGRCRSAHRRLRSTQQERRREPRAPIPRVRDALISRVHRPDPHAPMRLTLTAMPMLP